MDEDDTQVYKDHGDALTIAYQSGYYDGKKAAQPAQEPVAWAVYDKRGGSKSLHWPEQHSSDGDANMFDAVPLVPQRPWVDLTDADWKEIENMPDTFDQGVAWCLARLKRKNT